MRAYICILGVAFLVMSGVAFPLFTEAKGAATPVVSQEPDKKTTSSETPSPATSQAPDKTTEPSVTLPPDKAGSPSAKDTKADQVEAKAPGNSQESVFDLSKAEFLVLELRFDRYILNDALLGYLYRDRLLLPLGEVVRSLDFAINVDVDAKRAEGWFLSENRRFFLDVGRNELVINGRAKSFDPNQVVLDPEDIFIDSTLLEKWFPVNFEFSLSSLLVKVTSEETLPFQSRLLREEAQSTIGRGSKAEKYPRQELPYVFLDWPSIDSSYNFDYSNADEGNLGANSSTLISGDFLFMNTEVFTTGNKDDVISSLRMKMGREDSDAKLLGPLKVTEFSMGDISSPQLPLVARGATGVGLQLSNFPLRQESEFDRINLRGELQAGWEVELYRNEILLNVQSEPDANGRYEFLDVPLLFGSNVLRLVFYGPQGQRREKIQRLNVGGDQASPGKQYFRFSTTYQNEKLFEVSDQETDIFVEKGDGKARYTLEYQRGLNRWLSMDAIFASLPLPDGRRYFSTLGLKTGLFGASTRVNLTKNDVGGTAFESSVLMGLGPLSMFFEHTQFFDFLSERETNTGDSVVSRSETRLDSSIPAWLFVPRIPWSISGSMEVQESGLKQIELSNRLSVLYSGVSASNTTDWSLTRGGDAEPSTSGSGSAQLSGRISNVSLRGTLSYEILPNTIFNSASLSSDFKISQDFSANLGLNKQLTDDGLTSYSAGINRRFTAFSIGLNASYDNTGAFSAGTSITYSLGREPRKGSWGHSSDRMASSGMVSVRVFLDTNANQVFDEGDEPLKGVKVAPGGDDQKTDEDGILLLRGLSSSQPTNIVLDTDSLEDPYWVPSRKGYEVIGRPGRPIMLEFPVTPTGEIDGTVYLLTGDSEKPVGNVQIQLVNDKQEVIQEVKSEYDGFYLIQLVPQGRYSLIISPDQIKRLGLKTPDPKEVIIAGEETLQSGVDLLLEQVNPVKNKAKKEKSKSVSEKSTNEKSASYKSADVKKPTAEESDIVEMSSMVFGPLNQPPNQSKTPEIETSDSRKLSAPEKTLKFIVKKIKVAGSSLFPKEELEALVKLDGGKEVGLEELILLAQKLTSYYVLHGYFLSKAYIPAQKLIDGSVEIYMTEEKN